MFLGFELRDFFTMFDKGAYPAAADFCRRSSRWFPRTAFTSGGLHLDVVMMAQVLVFGIERDVKIRILRLGLFWHFLDIVWIGIFSVVYLQGLAR